MNNKVVSNNPQQLKSRLVKVFFNVAFSDLKAEFNDIGLFISSIKVEPLSEAK